MKEELNVLIKAQYPLIYLVTYEEERAEHEIARILQGETLSETPYRRLIIWTATSGSLEYGQPRTSPNHNTLSPEAAIDRVIRDTEPGLYVFRDLHPFLSSPTVTRRLRDAISSIKGTDKTMVLISPVQEIPIELQTEVVVVDFALPDLKALDEVLSKQMRHQKPSTLKSTAREKLLKAALGLTRDEAEKVYRKAQVMRGRLTGDDVDVVLSEKKTTHPPQWDPGLHRRRCHHGIRGGSRGTEALVTTTLQCLFRKRPPVWPTPTQGDADSRGSRLWQVPHRKNHFPTVGVAPVAPGYGAGL